MLPPVTMRLEESAVPILCGVVQTHQHRAIPGIGALLHRLCTASTAELLVQLLAAPRLPSQPGWHTRRTGPMVFLKRSLLSSSKRARVRGSDRSTPGARLSISTRTCRRASCEHDSSRVCTCCGLSEGMSTHGLVRDGLPEGMSTQGLVRGGLSEGMSTQGLVRDGLSEGMSTQFETLWAVGGHEDTARTYTRRC